MKLNLSQLILIQAIENSFDHIVITDVNGVIIYANAAVERITGYSRREIIGNTPALWGKQMPEEFYKEMWHTIKDEKKDYVGEITNKRKDGTLYTARIVLSPIKNEDGTLMGFIGTEEDITVQKEIERMKDDMVSMISHQLRTPTSAISWYSEMLLGDVAGSMTDSQREIISHIYDSAQRMNVLINSFLSVSVLESGKFHPVFSETDIKCLVQKVLDELKPGIDSKSIKATSNITDDLKRPISDEKHLHIVLSNLISNAIKYSPNGGSIKVFAKEEEDKIVVCVSDEGYGIPEENQNKIFEKFFRAKNVTEFESEGSGLGLYLSKKIIAVLGGDIWFESKPEKGTTFSFSVPLRYTPKNEVTESN